MLYVSGQLNLEMGGPGFQLFALEKTEHSPHYEYHKFDHSDPATYRRSIYRFVVRSQPDPYMTTLDCADSSQSTPVRNETQTPLQSPYGGILGWIDARLPIIRLLDREYLKFRVPRNLNYIWSFGGILMISLMLLLVTGIVVPQEICALQCAPRNAI